jgi:hypothetical protein
MMALNLLEMVHWFSVLSGSMKELFIEQEILRLIGVNHQCRKIYCMPWRQLLKDLMNICNGLINNSTWKDQQTNVLIFFMGALELQMIESMTVYSSRMELISSAHGVVCSYEVLSVVYCSG